MRGAALARACVLGDPLIELARPGSIAVRAFIDETWVLDIPEGCDGLAVLLAAFPDQPIPVQLERITTEAQMRDGSECVFHMVRL